MRKTTAITMENGKGVNDAAETDHHGLPKLRVLPVATGGGVGLFADERKSSWDRVG